MSRVATVVVVALAVVGLNPPSALAQLTLRSFLPLHGPPSNYRLDANLAVSSVVARADGLVFVGGWERHVVYVVDARDPDNPTLVCEFTSPEDACGLSLEPGGQRLWVGGDDQNPDIDGLAYVDIPADPFAAGCPYVATIVSGVSSGVTPNMFRGADGRRYVAIANRFCLSPHVSFVALDGPAPTPVGPGLFLPDRVYLADMSVLRTSSGTTFGALAAGFAGVYVVDLSDFPWTPVPPIVAHFDWTLTAPDFDANPLTNDPCDNNGDGDFMECTESGDVLLGGAWYNNVKQAAFAEAGGNLYLITSEGKKAGHVKVWSWADIVGTCPGPAGCPDDHDCLPLPGRPLCGAQMPPLACVVWPMIDIIRPVAFYQVDACPLQSNLMAVQGEFLHVAYSEAGYVVFDLGAQGLPPTSTGTPFEMTPFDGFDTLVPDSDTILQNYPCHPVGVAEPNCEIFNGDWPPSPCDPGPPPGAAFSTVLDRGTKSAYAVATLGCLVYVTDQGTSDNDGAPTHAGQPQGLWIFDVVGLPFDVELLPSLQVERSPGIADQLDVKWNALPVAQEYQVHEGHLDTLRTAGYDHSCAFRTPIVAQTLPGRVGTPIAPQPNFYYLVTPVGCGGQEGRYGTDSLGNERPPSVATCP